MPSHLHRAYSLGAQLAVTTFQKHAAEGEANPNAWGEGSSAGDVLTPMLGALPLVGAPLAGLVSGNTTPLSPGGVGAMTTAGSAAGQAAGGVGGAAVGAGLGGLAGLLAQEYKPEWGLDPARGAGYGAAIGGGLGLLTGGAYGAHKGRQVTEEAAKNEVSEELMDRLRAQENRAAQNEAALQAIMRARTLGRNEAQRPYDMRGDGTGQRAYDGRGLSQAPYAGQ